jgi:hypothetical protein
MLGQSLLLALTIAVAPATPNAKSPAKGEDFYRLAVQAMTAEGPAADRAIATLRARGPEALDRLIAALGRIRSRQAARTEPLSDEALAAENKNIQKLESVIDRVAGQRYAHVSRLYWYTDLGAAKAAARASGKPIISLRMLGKLTDEFSCANSRFFRTTLYANQQIARRLGEDFVMHWQSVRPVPRVTIDFGDGRKLERTITGNSAHYALAADGTPVDVLPGLYGPQQFLAWLDEVEALYGRLARFSPQDRTANLRRYHAARAREIARRWADDLKAIAPETSLGDWADTNQLTRATTDEHWKKIALLPSHRVALDASTQSIIRRENPDAVRAGNVAVTKRATEFPVLRLVVNLQTSIAEDQVRNEYTLHRQAHEWFAAGSAPPGVDELNNRVYAELFLTPASDPWLGLAPADTYTALDRGGVAVGR